jgi:hypothetical protein
MPRPSVSEELNPHLEAVSEERADIPAHHLTFEQKVSLVLTQFKKKSQESSPSHDGDRRRSDPPGGAV